MNISFSIDWFFITVLFFIGAYCMIFSRNIIKILIGLEIISKSVVISLITAGQFTNNINLAQNIIIVMILVEAVVIASGLAIIVKFYRINQTIDISKILNLKG